MGLGASPGSCQPCCSELGFSPWTARCLMQQHQDLESHPDLMPISLQGIFVLLFHCVTHREVRKHLRAVLAGKKLHLDDSSATRATLLTVRGARDPPPGLGAGNTVHSRVGSCKDQTNHALVCRLHILELFTHHRAELSWQFLCPTVAPLARSLERPGQISIGQPEAMSIGSEMFPLCGPGNILTFDTRLQFAALSPPLPCWQGQSECCPGGCLREVPTSVASAHQWPPTLSPLALPQLQQHLQRRTRHAPHGPGRVHSLSGQYHQVRPLYPLFSQGKQHPSCELCCSRCLVCLPPYTSKAVFVSYCCCYSTNGVALEKLSEPPVAFHSTCSGTLTAHCYHSGIVLSLPHFYPV